jgi:translation initiation factor IF-1
MAREDAIQVEGKVIEVLPNTTVRVELPNGHRILAYLSGRLRMAFIRLVPGDQVCMEMSPYDLSKGCIVGKTGGI